MIQYKIAIVDELKERGYSTYRLRKEKLIGESYLTQIRKGQLVSWEIINRLCMLLDCQPGDLVEYVPDDPDN